MRLETVVLVLSVVVSGLLLGSLASDESSPFNKVFNTHLVWHPLFMVLGVLLCLSQSLVAYVADYGEKINSMLVGRSSRRALHGTLSSLGVLLCGMGYLVVLALHSQTGQSNTGEHVRKKSLTAHVWMGYITLCGLLIQAGFGLHKFVVRTKHQLNVARWHVVFGPVVYVSAAITIILGVEAGYWQMDSSKPWGLVMMFLVSFLAVLTTVVVFCKPGTKTARSIRQPWAIEASVSLNPVGASATQQP